MLEETILGAKIRVIEKDEILQLNLYNGQKTIICRWYCGFPTMVEHVASGHVVALIRLYTW